MQMTLRWYGSKFETVTLQQIRQIPGVKGVITTLYDTKPGEVWSRERIRAMIDEVEAAGLSVAGIESVNIHDDIKTGGGDCEIYIDNYIQTLENLGINVLLVNPEDEELLTAMISLIAEATGTQERAQALLAFADEQKASLTELLKDADKPSVYLAGNSSFLSTAGSAMYQSDMISLAGGDNVAAAIEDSYWVEIGYEQLLAWDPACIVLASDAAYTVDDVLADPNLADCAAVKNGRVYQLPSKAEAWDSPVPSSILGSLWLANVLHPELLDDAACADVIDEYYETFYGFTYSEH